MNYKGVCRTVPATPGLLNTSIKQQITAIMRNFMSNLELWKLGKSTRRPPASSHVLTLNIGSLASIRRFPLEGVTLYSPCGPSPTTPQWSRRSLSTRGPHWWLTLGTPLVFFWLLLHDHLRQSRDSFCWIASNQVLQKVK